MRSRSPESSIISCYIMLQYIESSIISCYIMLHYIILHYIIYIFYIILYYTILYYIMSHASLPPPEGPCLPLDLLSSDCVRLPILMMCCLSSCLLVPPQYQRGPAGWRGAERSVQQDVGVLRGESRGREGTGRGGEKKRREEI